MNETILITVFALSLVIIKLMISGNKDPIGYILLFYFIFGFGPVINYIYGLPIYFGTVKEYIPQASFIMLLGMSSFAIPHLLLPSKRLIIDKKSNEKHDWYLLKVIFILSLFYSVMNTLIMIPLALNGATKVQMVNSSVPQLHYIYLLIQLYLTAFYFTCQKTIMLRKLYWANFISYICYCLVSSERDFIFPLTAVFILKSITSKNKISAIKMFFAVTSLGLLATLIFLFRDSTQDRSNILASFLNQGSILFINTYVLKLFEEGQNFFYGKTFIHSFINLTPSFIYKTDYNNLEWFKNMYAQASDSGYGFSLDAEGYMNFGYLGVVLVYGSISFYWKLLLNKFHKSEFFRYLTFFSTVFFMYSIRSDSLAVLKGSLYAALFYLILNSGSYLYSIRKRV